MAEYGSDPRVGGVIGSVLVYQKSTYHSAIVPRGLKTRKI